MPGLFGICLIQHKPHHVMLNSGNLSFSCFLNNPGLSIRFITVHFIVNKRPNDVINLYVDDTLLYYASNDIVNGCRQCYKIVYPKCEQSICKLDRPERVITSFNEMCSIIMSMYQWLILRVTMNNNLESYMIVKVFWGYYSLALVLHINISSTPVELWSDHYGILHQLVIFDLSKETKIELQVEKI